LSSIFLMTLIIFAVFACMYGMCEWIVRLRNSAGGPGPSGEAPGPAARRRVARRLERDRDGQTNADAE
jgi:hypothetical protein